jgi:hypothetical protein
MFIGRRRPVCSLMSRRGVSRTDDADVPAGAADRTSRSSPRSRSVLRRRQRSRRVRLLTEREAALLRWDRRLARSQVLAFFDDHRSTAARVFATSRRGVSRTDDADGSADTADTASRSSPRSRSVLRRRRRSRTASKGLEDELFERGLRSHSGPRRSDGSRGDRRFPPEADQGLLALCAQNRSVEPCGRLLVNAGVVEERRCDSRAVQRSLGAAIRTRPCFNSRAQVGAGPSLGHGRCRCAHMGAGLGLGAGLDSCAHI